MGIQCGGRPQTAGGGARSGPSASAVLRGVRGRNPRSTRPARGRLQSRPPAFWESPRAGHAQIFLLHSPLIWRWWVDEPQTGERYSGDNRLILPKSSHRRQGLEPRCRLIASWGWSRSQGFGCSPIKAVRELGSERRETVRSLSAMGVGCLRGAVPSTRGPEWTNLWCARPGPHAHQGRVRAHSPRPLRATAEATKSSRKKAILRMPWRVLRTASSFRALGSTFGRFQSFRWLSHS